MARPEMVLCVKRGAAAAVAPGPLTRWDSALGHADGLIRLLATASYRERTAALEEDESVKQVIPYVIIEDPLHHLILTYRRAGREARLGDHQSIGLGGHLNPRDGAHLGFAGFVSGLMRELDEELNQPFIVTASSMIGYLNDDSDPVGRVHLGVAVHAAIPGLDVERCREGKQWHWQSRPALAMLPPGILESWSQLIVDSWGNP